MSTTATRTAITSLDVFRRDLFVGGEFRSAVDGLRRPVRGPTTGEIITEVAYGSREEGVPFGGMKEPGIGREGSRHGVVEFTEINYLAMDGIGG